MYTLKNGIAIVATCLAITMSAGAQAANHSFGGLDCEAECAEHAAGYLWAKSHGVLDPNFCPAPAFEGFHEGCLVYSSNPFRNAEYTDDQLEIKGVAGALLKMRLLLGS
jgi:hypothetical protein